MADEDSALLTDDEKVDEAIDESFPASDPPFWTSGIDRERHASPPPRTATPAAAPGGRRSAAPPSK